jgi:hypothetical protein
MFENHTKATKAAITQQLDNLVTLPSVLASVFFFASIGLHRSPSVRGLLGITGLTGYRQFKPNVRVQDFDGYEATRTPTPDGLMLLVLASWLLIF